MTCAEQELTRDLERRLTDAEATIAALLSGQIDAVVDPRSQTPVLLAKAQDALREERDRAKRYLDTPDVILLALDMDGCITLINRYACAVLGRPAAELLGRNWIATCVPERMRDAVGRTLQGVLNSELTVGENPVLTNCGEERLIGWRNTVLRDDDGRVIGTFSSGADITERHRAAAALTAADERAQFVLKSAGVGTWDMDYATGLLQWSDTLEGQYGLPQGTFAGTFPAFVDRIHPEDRASVLKTMQAAKKHGTDFSLEHRVRWPDGTVRWLTGAGRIFLDEHGVAVRGVGISQDVTARHTLEAQFQQAQKMEAVGRLAGGVAHDFNNLLTVILGYCELLLAGADPSEPRHAEIAEIQKAGISAAGLTRQLLAFSRKQIIEPKLLDLNVVISGMQAMLERLIGKDVSVAICPAPQGALVVADRGQIEQVVMNLAVNARDAMPAGGVLTIELANVVLDEHYASTHLAVSPGPYVALSVTDTGTGMTAEVRAQLFDPFFTTKEPGRGTGLGMATVYGIVSRSGGTVSVYSEVGKGTSFKVYLPRADAGATVVDTPQPAARSWGGTETVLVAEDEDGLRELATRMLRRQGYTVLVAANADEALRLFESHPSIDLLLTDVVMPGMSGSELAIELHARRPAFRVLYMSGYTEEFISSRGILEHGIVLLHKPFTAETLGQKIREALDR